jgi:hypothetical protein
VCFNASSSTHVAIYYKDISSEGLVVIDITFLVF